MGGETDPGRDTPRCKRGGEGMKEMGEKVDHRPENKAVMESG